MRQGERPVADGSGADRTNAAYDAQEFDPLLLSPPST
ncbi:hypothetical protein HNR00_002124 [Methylorubrum rhodinum]|uniref:Uncharacterized protein n=1 Tax=Methylorubrum rhodinum TaxID=29428 RepID=A0A840ZK96_9HYPH|nr:hypothetical protein [Methylorubrum rhodinum]